MRIPNIPLQNIMSMHNVMGLEMQMSNRNQCIMMTSSNGNNFPRYWPFVRGIHRSPVNSPHKGQWRGALMFSLIGDRINGWVNNREAGDLKRHVSTQYNRQATGLDAWASRVKCPARFVSHLHEIWVVHSLCFFCCLFITVTWWHVWWIEWASGNQEEVQACLVTLWLFIISCYSLYKTTLGLLCSWFENNPHFHKYSIDFHVQCVYLDYFLWDIWLK